ncbi:MAG: tetratricopeptide repeat protein [Phycisphaerales bacterium]
MMRRGMGAPTSLAIAAGLAMAMLSCGGGESPTAPGSTATPDASGADATPALPPSGVGVSPQATPDAQRAQSAPPRPSLPRPQVPAEIPAPTDPAALDPGVRARIDELLSSLASDRTAGKAWLALADTLLAHGEPAGAAAAYAGAVALLADGDPQLERAAYLRAVALSDAGETTASVEAIAPLAASSRTPQVQWRFALLLAAEGRLEEAVAAARAAVALDARDMRAHAALAQVASEAGDWATAEQAARAGLAINPRNGHLYGILAASLRAQGRENEASALLGAGRFTRADWLDPWLRDLRAIRLGQAAAIERFYEAMRAGDAARANAELEVVARTDDDASKGRVALMRAQLAVSSNDHASAAKHLDEAAAGGAPECDVAIVRATIVARQASTPEALEPIVAALEPLACEGDAESTRLELIGSIRLAQRRWSDAATAIAAADAARPGGAGPGLKKAIATMDKAGAHVEARMLAERLRDAEPLNPEPHLLIAVLSLRAGDIATARAAAAEVGRIAPNHPALRKLMGEIQQASR